MCAQIGYMRAHPAQKPLFRFGRTSFGAFGALILVNFDRHLQFLSVTSFMILDVFHITYHQTNPLKVPPLHRPKTGNLGRAPGVSKKFSENSVLGRAEKIGSLWSAVIAFPADL